MNIESLGGAALWVLITVTNAGVVHQEPGFTSKALCEDAISIARYGKTVAEHEKDESEEEKRQRDAAIARRTAEATWRYDHPPRRATATTPILNYGFQRCSHSKKGWIYDDPPERCLGTIDSRPTLTLTSEDVVKFARCLPDPDAAEK